MIVGMNQSGKTSLAQAIGFAFCVSVGEIKGLKVLVTQGQTDLRIRLNLPGWTLERSLPPTSSGRPKYRRPVLTPPIDAWLKQLISQVCSETQTEIFKMEIMPDHVHLLVECDPQFGINRLVRSIKGRSSRVLRPLVSKTALKDSLPVDKQLFCLHRRRCAAGRDQAPHRESETHV